MPKLSKNLIHVRNLPAGANRPVRKQLNADAILATIHRDFKKIPDTRADNAKIALSDIFMSALALFHLKYPSLLQFDRHRQEEPENLHTIYGIKTIPCDSQMRAALDPQNPEYLRAPFRSVLRLLQRGKELEKMVFLDGHYLLSADGTGFFSSQEVNSPLCQVKKRKDGTLVYELHMFAAALVNPHHNMVIPLCPEIIHRQDGSRKNDCERNAAKRFFAHFREDHPFLKVIVIEDALSSNGPHIGELKRHDLRFILGAKPGDHQSLFEAVNQAAAQGRVSELHHIDPKNRQRVLFYRFINDVPLNGSHPDLLVNFLECVEVGKDEKIRTFSWVTDLPLTVDNVGEIALAGRARWRVENEVFNTMKNLGYNLGHNYGMGKQNLPIIFATLMMLAFLIDQAQELACWLFQAARAKAQIRRELWERIRGYFREYQVDSMETILRAVAFGVERRNLREVFVT
jgi:hypothetical protein